MAQEILVKPIGIIHTPHQVMLNTPIQPIAAQGVKGRIELYDEYVTGLSDLDGFSHITLLYHFHQISGHTLKVIPFMDTEERGIFATKAPKRPNRIGVSTVKLLNISGNIIDIEEVDMLDGTPLLDIKPFYPRYDNRSNVAIGWLERNKNLPVENMRADERFR